LLLVHFGADLFGANFMKIIFFLLLFVSIYFSFLIYKNYFFPSFLFFSKTVEDVLFIFNEFLSTQRKEYKFKHTTTVFYSVIPVTDKINS